MDHLVSETDNSFIITLGTKKNCKKQVLLAVLMNNNKASIVFIKGSVRPLYSLG